MLAALFIQGCGSANDKVIPTDTSKWDAEIHELIPDLETDDEQNLLRQYLVRVKRDAEAGTNPIPPGVTISKAISLQRDFHKKETEERARLKREENERETALLEAETKRLTLRIEAKKILVGGSVTVSDSMNGRRVSNLPQGPEYFKYMDKFPGLAKNLEIPFKNEGQKEIVRFIGTLQILNHEKKVIDSIQISSHQRMSPGESFTYSETHDPRDFIAAHQALAYGDYDWTRFDPSFILFGDKSELISP